MSHLFNSLRTRLSPANSARARSDLKVVNPVGLGEAGVPHLSNSLLARLSQADFSRLEPELKVVDLEFGRVLAECHEKINRVYFPHGGIISCVVDMLGGGAIETAMIGRDGVFGGGQALDDRVSLNRVMVQMAGQASVIEGAVLDRLAQDMPALRKLVLSYDQFFTAQVQQTAACNAAHNVGQRLCRWLLRMHYLVGNDLRLTQEFLAQMMGVRRTSVTEAAVSLQAAGAITYSRGRIVIVDVAKLRTYACDCEDEVHSHYKRMFDPGPLET